MTETADPVSETQRARRPAWRRWLPLALLVAGAVLFVALGGHRLMSVENLQEHRTNLHRLVEEHGALASLGYVALYVATASLSVPGSVVLTVAGGFLFGTLLGGLYAAVAATTGATIVFLIARSAVGASLGARIGPRMRRMEAGFRANAFSYLLVLRLVPLFPFWLVNLVPAFLGVPARTFVLATAIGVVPASFIFASVGSGLDSVFASGRPFSPEAALTPQVRLALLGLALLALAPAAYRLATRRRT